ncbi:MAG: hypothetical protein KJ060_08780, partial [Candidatus Hydrogenedentes bacterium]|nr:hypothetical protein [Candidatus Hydrogenedentota bacterium]
MKRTRLEALTTLLLLAFVVMPHSYGQPNEDVAPMLPNGSNMLAYLNCGTAQSAYQEHGVRIALTHGESRVSSAPEAPFSGEAADADRVEFSVNGLQAGFPYVLAFTWFDANGEGREQSVQFKTGDEWETVLPHAKPLAFHGDRPTWARVLLPIPARFIQDGSLSVAFVREAGESIGVNELWLLGSEPIDVRKRVLIVTGDDWTG